MIPRQTNRIYVPLTEINTEGRVRSDYGDMEGLCESLTKHGLLQPIVINQDKKLVAGGRRFRAHEFLKETEIGVVFYETLSDLQLRVLEVEENVVRKDFDWREKVCAIATAHETASKDAILNKQMMFWTQEQTGTLLGVSMASVSNAITLAKYIRNGDKEIVECESAREAWALLFLRKEREGQKRLADFITQKANTSTAVSKTEVDDLLSGKKPDTDDFFGSAIGGSGGGVTAPTVDELPGAKPFVGVRPALTTIPLSSLVKLGDCFTLMSSMPPESVDHIVTDIPYGIDMDNIENNESVKNEHQVEENVENFADFMAESFRVLRPNAFNVFFCDIHHWEKLRDAAYAVGYKVQRWPLIWDKTSPCKNVCAQWNWTKSSEIAMVLRKGKPTILTPQARNVWSGPNSTDLDHPFAKPTLLWQWVYRAIALPGQVVLDPFAGVGSAALAAIPLGLVPISFEISDTHFHKLIENVQNAYKALDPNIQFT